MNDQHYLTFVAFPQNLHEHKYDIEKHLFLPDSVTMATWKTTMVGSSFEQLLSFQISILETENSEADEVYQISWPRLEPEAELIHVPINYQ